MKTFTFIQIKDFIHDASGTDNPNNYLWYKHDNGVYYPIIEKDNITNTSDNTKI